MRRKKAAAVGALLSLSGYAHALDYYAGVALGANHASSDYASQVARARSDPGGPPTDVSLDKDRRTVGRIFAGARLHPRWAVELDYADLGRLKTYAMWHGVEPFYQFERFGKIDVRAASLSLVGSAPVTQWLDVFARAGAAYTWVDYQTVGNAFVRSNPSQPGTSFPSPTPPRLTGNGVNGLLAVGLDHRIAGNWRVRAEYMRYFDVGKAYTMNAERGKFDLDAATLGLTFAF